jgi:HSP20 family protein
MTMIRRTNDRNVVPLRAAIERFMDWPFGQFDPGLTTELAPPIDVRETNDAYVVDIDLPGIDAKNTEILVEGRTLSVKGHFSEEHEEKAEGGYLLRERRSGDFVRAIALPGMVDTEGATSTFENGLLTVTLPKAMQNRARRIEIQPGRGQNQVTSGQAGNGQKQAMSSGQYQAAGQAQGTTPGGSQTKPGQTQPVSGRS